MLSITPSYVGLHVGMLCVTANPSTETLQNRDSASVLKVVILNGEDTGSEYKRQ